MSGRAQAYQSSSNPADFAQNFEGSLVGGTPQVVATTVVNIAGQEKGWVLRDQVLTGHMSAVGTDMSTNGCLYLQFFDLAAVASLSSGVTVPKRSVKIPYGANPVATYNPAGNSQPDVGGSNAVLSEPAWYQKGIVVALSSTPAVYTAATNGNILFLDGLGYTVAGT